MRALRFSIRERLGLPFAFARVESALLCCSVLTISNPLGSVPAKFPEPGHITTGTGTEYSGRTLGCRRRVLRTNLPGSLHRVILTFQKMVYLCDGRPLRQRRLEPRETATDGQSRSLVFASQY